MSLLENSPVTGLKSVANKSVAPLAAAATFTGGGEQNNLPQVAVSCQSDASGTLFFDFSNDDLNWSTFPVNGFALNAGIHTYHAARKDSRYFRVRLVNGSTDQTYLRLYTYYGQTGLLSAPLNQNIGLDSDAITTRSVDSSLDLAFGKFTGMSEGNKFGYSAGLTTAIQIGNSATWVDLWAYGGQRTSQTTIFTPYMASSNAADVSKEVTWEYLDENGLEQTVTVSTNALDGTTPVSLGVSATDITKGYISGASGCAGRLTVAINSGFVAGVPATQASVLAAITTGDNRTQLAMARVPANKRRRIKRLNCYMLRDNGSAGAVIAVFQKKESGGVWQTRENIFCTSAFAFSADQSDVILEPLTDFRVRIKDVSDNATYVAANIDYEDLEI